MAKYLHDIDEEKFNELYESKLADNMDVMKWLQKFIDEKDDRRFKKNSKRLNFDWTCW